MGKARTAAVVVTVLAVVAGAMLGVRAWRQARAEAEVRSEVRLWATVERLRPDELTHTVQIAVRNDGSLPVRVTRAQLVSASFAEMAPVDVNITLPVGGRRLDIQVPFGVGICAGDVNTASAPSQASLSVVMEDGETRHVTLDLPHPNELLDHLLGLECEQQQLAKVGTVRFGKWTQRPDGTLLGTLLVERTERPDELTVYDVRGSVLYLVNPDPADRARPLGTLAAGAPSLELPVIVDANRCTGHALGEAKKPYVFPVWLSIDGGKNIYSTIAISPADEQMLRDLSDRRCGNN